MKFLSIACALSNVWQLSLDPLIILGSLGGSQGLICGGIEILFMGIISIGIVPMGVVSMGVISMGAVAMGLINASVVGMGVLNAGVNVMGVWWVGLEGMGPYRLGCEGVHAMGSLWMPCQEHPEP